MLYAYNIYIYCFAYPKVMKNSVVKQTQNLMFSHWETKTFGLLLLP